MQSDQIVYLTIIVIAIGILLPGRAQNTAQTTSCQGRCLDPKLSTDKCHCHESCRFDGDCCNDFVEVCANQSCNCNTTTSSCTCAGGCLNLTSCCSDYFDVCNIPRNCDNRCHETYDKKLACYCDEVCVKYSNCCDDYESKCGSTAGDRIKATNIVGLATVMLLLLQVT